MYDLDTAMNSAKVESEKLKKEVMVLEKQIPTKSLLIREFMSAERQERLYNLEENILKLNVEIQSVKERPYSEWANSLSNEELLEGYKHYNAKVDSLRKSLDRMTELRDKHSKFSKSYKIFDYGAKEVLKYLNENTFKLNALCFKIDFGTNLKR